MIFSRALPAAALACLLSACAAGPDYEQPAIPVGDGWIDAAAVMTAPPPEAWWRQLDDPALDALIDAAVTGNLDIRQAAERIVEARALRARAAGDRYPALAAEASATRQRRSANGLLPAGRIPGLDTYQTIYDAGFDASWEADLFGRVKRSVEAAEARLGGAVEEHRDVIVTVIAEVARSYFELRGAQLELEASETSLAAARRTLELATIRYETGETPRSEVAGARAEREIAATALPPLRARRDAAALALGALLGELPESRFGLAADTPAGLPALRPMPVGERADVLRRRPDLRLAERRLAAATADIGVARGELYPRLVIGGGGSFQASEADELFDAASRTWSLAPLISWRIFDGGRVRAEIDAAESRARQAALGYEAAVIAALTDAEQRLQDYRRSLELAARRADAAGAARERRELVAVRYRAGDVALLELLNAERRLSESEAALARARTQAATGMVALYKALGGGWAHSAEVAAGAGPVTAVND